MSDPNYTNSLLPFDDDNSPTIEAANIRKVWHNGEWYFSIVDVVTWATGRDYHTARNYWRNLKSELKAAGNQLANKSGKVKMPAADSKMRLTDAISQTNLDALVRHLRRITYNTVERSSQKRDEICNIHPLVIDTLRKQGWKTTRHLELPSGKIIDIVAEREQTRLIVECKPKLHGGYLFHAIGQVLCYTSEFGHAAKPVLACPVGKADAYAYNHCRALGIDILEC